MTDLRPYLRAVAPSSKLTVGDRLVLLMLATYANDTGHAWPSSATLSDACGMHRDAVRHCLAHLVKAGVIAVEQRRDGHSTVYRFPLHPSTACVPANTPQDIEPVLARTQRCVPADTEVCSYEHTEVTRSKQEEEERAPVDNYGDAEAAKRMRQILEAARMAR